MRGTAVSETWLQGAKRTARKMKPRVSGFCSRGLGPSFPTSTLHFRPPPPPFPRLLLGFCLQPPPCSSHQHLHCSVPNNNSCTSPTAPPARAWERRPGWPPPYWPVTQPSSSAGCPPFPAAPMSFPPLLWHSQTLGPVRGSSSTKLYHFIDR